LCWDFDPGCVVTDGDVASGGRGIGELGRQKCRLDAAPPMGGRGRHAGHLSDAIGHPQARSLSIARPSTFSHDTSPVAPVGQQRADHRFGQV
jgi:hypothetical protein